MTSSSTSLPAILRKAVRRGRHVTVRMPRESHSRVVTIGAARSSPFGVRWYAGALESRDNFRAVTARSAVLSVQATTAAPYSSADVPRFVETFELEPFLNEERDGLVFEAPDGVSLEEIIVRSELQGAVVDTALAVHVAVRALRAIAAFGCADACDAAAMDVRVGWSGEVCFLGHVRPGTIFTAIVPVNGMPTRAPWMNARSLVARVARRVAGVDGVLAFIDAVKKSDTAPDRPGVVDATRYAELADRLADVAKALGPHDPTQLATIARALFPEDYAVASDVTEELAMIDDDVLAAVEEGDLA